jgi:hypothetical protein
VQQSALKRQTFPTGAQQSPQSKAQLPQVSPALHTKSPQKVCGAQTSPKQRPLAQSPFSVQAVPFGHLPQSVWQLFA